MAEAKHHHESIEGKETIYVDVDDEITGIIDKVRGSKQKIVALVLPKRASVLQSIVNMKLLKRTAERANKKVVLITSEAGLLPLAGAVGLHVAKTLQSKPEIPEPPEGPKADEDVIEEDSPEADSAKPASEPAGQEKAKPEAEAKAPTVAATAAAAKKDKKSKPKVPNFDSFRKKLMLGVGIFIGLILLWVWAYKIAPKATLAIKTETSDVAASPTINVDSAAKSVDVASNTLPGTFRQVKKTATQTGNATGQKDVGTKASGTITIRNCDYPNGFSISSGARFTGDNGKVFVSTSAVSVPKFTSPTSTGCSQAGSFSGKADVAVQALDNGDSYNVAGQAYSFSYSGPKVDAVGTAMSGGSSKIATVVSQQDLDNAKAKLPNNKEPAKAELIKQIQNDKLYAMQGTFSEGAPEITSSPNVGEPATSFTVTANTTYSILGVKEDDLKKLIDENIKPQIDEQKQQAQDYGLDNAGFTVADNKNNAQFKVSIQATVAVGPKINVDELKKQIAGKKKGQIRDLINTHPGVKDVTVKLSPFWVSKAPKKPSKITINFEKADDNANSR